jgi:hypothetical protein
MEVDIPAGIGFEGSFCRSWFLTLSQVGDKDGSSRGRLKSPPWLFHSVRKCRLLDRSAPAEAMTGWTPEFYSQENLR